MGLRACPFAFLRRRPHETRAEAFGPAHNRTPISSPESEADPRLWMDRHTPYGLEHPRDSTPSLYSVTVPIAVALVTGLGLLLILAATRATANVEDGPSFIRWMVVVFVCFLVLASLPVVIAF